MSKAIFLDRDGVINEVLTERVKFVNNPSQFYLLNGVGEAIHKFNELGYHIFVVTNQGGIGLGYMKESELEVVHKKMIDELNRYGATIDEVIYCPHKPNEGCKCRKPSPNMLIHLAKKHNVNINYSYMVGDRTVDIEAGRAAGATTVLVGDRDRKKANAHFYFADLLSFANWLTKN